MRHFLLALVLFAAVCGSTPEVLCSDPGASYAAAVLDGRTLHDDSLESVLMARSMPYRVFLPENYAMKQNEERLYPVIYLLHGLTGNYKNWSDLTKLKGFGFEEDLIIVMPEGANGWYTDSATESSEKYESYIIKELVPDVEKKFRAKKERKGRVIAGLSMGGYGALKYGIKYADMFVLTGSFSGALRAPEWDPATLGGFPAAANSIKNVYGPMDNPVRKANDIYLLVKGLDQTASKNLPFMYLDCGTEDFLLPQSQDFAKLLLEKKIPHEFRQRPGGHDWKFWNAQVEQFLTLAAGFTGDE